MTIMYITLSGCDCDRPKCWTTHQNHVIVAIAMIINVATRKDRVVKDPTDFFTVGVVDVVAVVCFRVTPASWKNDLFSTSSGLVPRGRPFCSEAIASTNSAGWGSRPGTQNIHFLWGLALVIPMVYWCRIGGIVSWLIRARNGNEDLPLINM